VFSKLYVSVSSEASQHLHPSGARRMIVVAAAVVVVVVGGGGVVGVVVDRFRL
jgi:hypothetical protein